MKRKIIMATVAGLAAFLVLPALVSGASEVGLKAMLTGAQEVPAGDPNGRGTAKVTVKLGQRKLCANVEFKRIENPTAAHVHKGRKGVAGPIVVGLWEETQISSPVRTCATSQEKSLLRKIARKPKRYYLNLHNDDYPAGAIRGQLKNR